MKTLREYRKANHLTQEGIAALIGIKQASVSRLESGRSKPDWETARKIAEATGGAVPVEVWAKEKGAA